MDTDPAVSPDLVAGMLMVGERGLGVEGVHLQVRGHAPVEHHWVADVRRDIYSISKTFTSAAIGIAEYEGLLGLDDPVLDHLGHLTTGAATGFGQVRIRHLLTMTSGIVYRWNDPDADHPGDPAEDIMTTPLGAVPGSTFYYRGANTYLLSRIIRACSGQDLRDFLVPRLFEPLGIRNPQWLRCPLGYSMGAVGLLLRTGEIARLGRVLLDDGRYEAQQIVPADYVAAMVTDSVPTGEHLATGATGPHPDNARYGRHVWLCDRDDAWRMDGIYGQFSIMLPGRGACITVTSHYQGPTTDILDAIWSDIIPLLPRSIQTPTTPRSKPLTTQIVPATAADQLEIVDSITDLVNEVYRLSEAGLWTEGTSRTDGQEISDLIRRGEIASARSGDDLVGVIRVHQLDADTGGFGMLAAATSHRGQGIGTRLVDFAESWARARGLTTMQLEVLSPRDWQHPSKMFLLDWYERIGYQRLRNDLFEQDFPTLAPLLATSCDLIVFRKDLI